MIVPVLGQLAAESGGRYKIAKLNDADMEYLAQKMEDRYVGCCYWDHLDILGEELLKK